jgi:hypothetical protein
VAHHLEVGSVLAVVILCASPAAADPAPACPPSILVSQSLTTVPAGFRAFEGDQPPAPAKDAPAAHALTAISFSEGPPSQSVWLAPTAGGKGTHTWDFTSRGRSHLAFLRLPGDQPRHFHTPAAPDQVLPRHL